MSLVVVGVCVVVKGRNRVAASLGLLFSWSLIPTVALFLSSLFAHLSSPPPLLLLVVILSASINVVHIALLVLIGNLVESLFSL